MGWYPSRQFGNFKDLGASLSPREAQLDDVVAPTINDQFRTEADKGNPTV